MKTTKTATTPIAFTGRWGLPKPVAADDPSVHKSESMRAHPDALLAKPDIHTRQAVGLYELALQLLELRDAYMEAGDVRSVRSAAAWLTSLANEHPGGAWSDELYDMSNMLLANVVD